MVLRFVPENWSRTSGEEFRAIRRTSLETSAFLACVFNCVPVRCITASLRFSSRSSTLRKRDFNASKVSPEAYMRGEQALARPMRRWECQGRASVQSSTRQGWPSCALHIPRSTCPAGRSSVHHILASPHSEEPYPAYVCVNLRPRWFSGKGVMRGVKEKATAHHAPDGKFNVKIIPSRTHDNLTRQRCKLQ